jgi:hypothetical protein
MFKKEPVPLSSPSLSGYSKRKSMTTGSPKVRLGLGLAVIELELNMQVEVELDKEQGCCQTSVLSLD